MTRLGVAVGFGVGGSGLVYKPRFIEVWTIGRCSLSALAE